MAISARPARSRFQAPWLLPAGALAVVLIALAGIVWLSGKVGGDDLPPAAPPFDAALPAAGYTRFTVKQAAEGKLIVVGDVIQGQPPPAAHDLLVTASTAIERLRVVTADSLKPGDPVAIIGIPNEVRNFSIHSLVVVDKPAAPDADRVVRSPAGFAGYEAASDPKDRVIVTGTLDRFEGGKLFLKGPGGTMEVTVTKDVPLYRLESGTAAAIKDGDRIAAKGAGTATAVLLGTPR